MSKETFNLIVCMAEDERRTIKEISSLVDFDRQTIRRALKVHNSGESFMPSNEKRISTVKERTSVYNFHSLIGQWTVDTKTGGALTL